MNFAPVCEIEFLVPTSRYYVHNRVAPPKIDSSKWTMKVTVPRAPEAIFNYSQLCAMPAVTVDRVTDCGSNGRSFFPKMPPGNPPGAEPISGSEWRFGAMGMGRWTGARMSTVLRAAGVQPQNAKWVLVTGNDVVRGSNYAHVAPFDKAMQEDTLLVYKLNDEPLPVDHGFPVRALFSGWGANSNVKWVQSISVSAEEKMVLPPSQKNQVIDGVPVTVQNVKSAFELDWNTTIALEAGNPKPVMLTGRAWSGRGAIRKVEVSFDKGRSWTQATLLQGPQPLCWVRFQVEWRARPGAYELMARATDDQGDVQPSPEQIRWNQYGLLYNAHVGHPVVVTGSTNHC
jgi:DMSO/TMAO reductase YedYZ molybdopterin-dependent catalytic subunit